MSAASRKIGDCPQAASVRSSWRWAVGPDKSQLQPKAILFFVLSVEPRCGRLSEATANDLISMTLVVGRIDGPRLAIASDTLLTEHDKPLPFQSGVVKSCMLPGDICVSFSNSPVTAERAFGEFMTTYPNGTRYAEVISFFERSSRDTGNDYLVAFAHPAKVLKIADGRCSKSLSKTAWIGDQAAYDRFREYESRLRRKSEHGRALNVAYFADEMANSPASDLFSTMRNVVIDRTVPSAGGFVPVISNRDNGFRFSVYCDMLYDWPEAQPEEYNFAYTDKTSLQASGENAGYSVAQIAPGSWASILLAFIS